MSESKGEPARQDEKRERIAYEKPRLVPLGEVQKATGQETECMDGQTAASCHQGGYAGLGCNAGGLAPSCLDGSSVG